MDSMKKVYERIKAAGAQKNEQSEEGSVVEKAVEVQEDEEMQIEEVDIEDPELKE